MADTAIIAAREFQGSPTDRILFLMESVVIGKIARYDLPIAQWVKSDSNAKIIFKRAVKKRFEFATWMFAEAGFEKK